METLFAKIAAKAESDKLAGAHEWDTVIAKLAADTATEREVASALKANPSKSLTDMQADVKRQRRIIELRAVVATQPEALRVLEKTSTAEIEFNLARQAEFLRNRDDGIVIRSAGMEARANFDGIAVAQRELDSLIDTPVELPIGEAA